MIRYTRFMREGREGRRGGGEPARRKKTEAGLRRQRNQSSDRNPPRGRSRQQQSRSNTRKPGPAGRASGSRHIRPRAEKPVGLYVAVGGLGLALIAGLLMFMMGGDSPPKASRERIARVKQARPAAEISRTRQPKRTEPAAKPTTKPASEKDTGRAALLAMLEATRRKITAALDRGDVRAARTALEAFSPELMELADDDPLFQAVASLQAQIDKRAALLVGDPVNKPKPEPDPPRAQQQPPRASGPVDWNRATEIFMKHLRAKDYRGMQGHALQVIARAPKIYLGYNWLTTAQSSLNSPEAAYETAMKAIELYKTAPQEMRHQIREYYNFRPLTAILEQLGEFELARENVNRIKALSNDDPSWWTDKARVEYHLGNYDTALKAADDGFRIAVKKKSVKMLALLWYVGEAARALGRDAQARAAYQALTQYRHPVYTDIGYIGLARLAMLNTAGKFDRAAASAAMKRVRNTQLTVFYITHAMLSSVGGVHEQALESFESERITWRTRSPEVDWHHGVTLLALNHRGRAIERITIATRRNRHYRKRLDADPKVQPIARDVKRRLGDYDRGKDVEARIEVAEQHVTTEVLLAQIRSFIRTARFSQALEDLARLKRRVSGSSLAEAEAQVTRVKAYAALKRAVLKAIRNGPLKNHALQLAGAKAVGARLTGADDTHYTLALAGGGTAKGSWAQLPFKTMWGLFNRLGLTAAQQLRLADLSWECEASRLAERSLSKAWAAPEHRSAIVERIALHRGVSRTTGGGFVPHRGRFVTVAEKRQHDRGLVSFRGKWVTQSDKRHMLSNHEKINGKWVALTAEQLRQRGFIKYQGKWRTAKEIGQRRGEWKEAWTERTAHYEIKTNHSKQFALKLAKVVEQAYVLYKRLFGGEPKGTQRMRLLAFRTYEDYRAYCERTGNLAQLNATGFSPSEPRTACGYDKLKDERSLLQTMLHEGAHLFYQLAFDGQPESWLAEGMATYFEGFRLKSGGQIKFHHKPRMRRTLFRQALSQGRQIPLQEFFTADAGKLINSNANRALVFYSQAWAVHYFLRKSPDPRYRQGFLRYWKAVARGSKPNLLKLIGVPLAQMERDFKAFIRAE